MEGSPKCPELGEEQNCLGEGDKNIQLILYLDFLSSLVSSSQSSQTQPGFMRKGEITALQTLRILVFNNKCSFRESTVEQIN